MLRRLIYLPSIARGCNSRVTMPCGWTRLYVPSVWTLDMKDLCSSFMKRNISAHSTTLSFRIICQ